MKSIKNILLVLASISFVAIIGASIYEHVTMVPKWSAGPPQSLSMFQGKYGINPAAFWMSIHPVTMLLLIAALAANWKNDRKKPLLWVLGSYVVVMVITAIYFVPLLIQITTTPYQDLINEELRSKAALWEKLSLVRLLVAIVLSFVLLSSLTKPAEKTGVN